MAAYAPAPVAPAIVRQQSRLILPMPAMGQAVILPPATCIRCGAPADGKPLTKWYYWHAPAFYLTILLGVLVYVIVAVVVRKGMKVTVPLCVQHRQRRSIVVTLTWVLPLVGIADAFILAQFNIDGGIIALVTVALILSGLVVWAMAGNPIRPLKIDNFSGEFLGVCEKFLQQFPEGTAQQFVPVPATIPAGQVLPPPPPAIK
ncbi:MAG TPA: hypothetical protein VKW06_00775 [Candidatus Angelobacter sp.]|nr:hypothetical protein [Candidatus Angelobacter sp.]